MRTFREVYAKGLATHLDIPLAPDKVAVDLGGVAIFKTAQLLGKPTVQGVRDHRHHHIEVDLDEDRGRESIKVEEFDGFDNAVLNPPPTGVVADYQLHRGFKVFGDEEHRFFSPIATKGDLSQFSVIATEFHPGLMCHRLGILALLMRDGNPRPRFKPFHFLNQLVLPAPKSDDFEGGTRWPRKKSLMKFKDNIRKKTSRRNGKSLESIIRGLNMAMRG